MQGKSTQRCVVRIRQGVDQSMHRVSAHCIIVNTRSLNVLAIEFAREERIRQLAEELFQQSCNTVDIVLEGLGIAEIDLRGICPALVEPLMCIIYTTYHCRTKPSSAGYVTRFPECGRYPRPPSHRDRRPECIGRLLSAQESRLAGTVLLE